MQEVPFQLAAPVRVAGLARRSKTPCEPVCRPQDHRQRLNVEERHLGHQALLDVASRRSLNSIPISLGCQGVRQDAVRVRCRHRPFDDQHTKTLGSRVRFFSASRYLRQGRPKSTWANDSNANFNPAASNLVNDLNWSTSLRPACSVVNQHWHVRSYRRRSNAELLQMTKRTTAVPPKLSRSIVQLTSR